MPLKGEITTDRVRSALKRNGYEVEFLKATFAGMTPAGNEEHKFFYINEETGVLEMTPVYLWEHRGELYGDW